MCGPVISGAGISGLILEIPTNISHQFGTLGLCARHGELSLARGPNTECMKGLSHLAVMWRLFSFRLFSTL